jgi:hypothetical protein
MWHLQSTRHPLPATRFPATFGRQNRLSFSSGLAASLAWLRFIGIGASNAAPQPAPGVAGVAALAAQRER